MKLINLILGKGEQANRRAAGANTGPVQRIIASPLAKKRATEKNLDLQYINGSGPNGRILAHDVEEYAKSMKLKRSKFTLKLIGDKAKAKTDQAQPQKTSITYDQKTPSGNIYADRPVSSMRRVIAERLLESKTTIPHYYLTSKINMDSIIKFTKDQ